MLEMALWLYLVNLVLLIVHEMDSAFWKEWELFKLPGGLDGFLLIHIPLLALFLHGLVLTARSSSSGLIFSLVLAVSGIAAFSIHAYHLKKGRPAFDRPVSKFILAATLVVSLVQLIVAVSLLTA